jgi:hypothetical protein
MFSELLPFMAAGRLVKPEREHLIPGRKEKSILGFLDSRAVLLHD